MKFYLLVYAFFIPHILGSNDTTSSLEHKNSTKAVAKKVQKTTPPVTNTLITEGGTITQNTTLEDLISVHKGNHSHSTIVARKEAILNDTVDLHPNSNSTDNTIDKIKNKTHRKDSVQKNATEAVVSNIDVKNSSVTTSSMHSVETKKPEIEKPKKPLILSYEEVANADLKLETTAESQKSIPVSKIHPESQHPGMIMPVVIAILVVPMFAVLGYMALRRGQEAWKNRHYKRMDFLLDGMYNE